MKKIILLLLLSAAPAHAWQVEGNPDHRLSFGLTYNKMDLTGQFHYNDPSRTVLHTTRSVLQTAVIDARVPISQNWTLTGSVGRAFEKYSVADMPTIEIGSYRKSDGIILSAGVRMYL